jgi:peptidoglycan hydrolase CwlO-like protein
VTSSKGFRGARWAAVLTAAVVVGTLATAPVRADTKGELDAAKASLKSLEAKISAEQASINALMAQASSLATQIDHVNSRIANTQGQIADKEQQIRAAGDRLSAAQDQLNQRAWVAYENGPGSNLEFLLGSTSLSDLSDRLEIVNTAAQSDESLILEIHNDENLLASQQADLQSLENQLQSTNAELKTHQDALTAKLAAQQKLMDGMNKDETAAQALVNKLGAQYKAELAAAEAAKRAARGEITGVFFKCPVSGAVAYADDFGAPRYAGGYHLHAGNDILAAYGTPIVAPFPGTADADGNDLGGLAVTVTGAAGYVYNAHLSAYAGSFPRTVSTGELIGYVGTSGDAQGGPPHDHFEWHPNVIPPNPWVSPYGVSVIGTAIDPYPYLNSVC